MKLLPVVVLASCVAACSKSEPSAPTVPNAPASNAPAAPVYETTARDATGVRGIMLEGVEILRASDLKPAVAKKPAEPDQPASGAGSGTTTVLTLGGHEVRIENGTLTVDGARMGEVKTGDKVELRNDGVFVNGASRGKLP
jgi:hypothetical protein